MADAIGLSTSPIGGYLIPGSTVTTVISVPKTYNTARQITHTLGYIGSGLDQSPAFRCYMPSLPIYYRVYNDSTVKLSESYAAITFSGVNKTSRVYLSSWSGTVTIPALDFSYWSPSFGSMTITFTIYVANTDYTFDPTVEITAASPSITCQLSTIAFQV